MSRLTAELVTDVGKVRAHNEDYALTRSVHHPSGNFHLWIVADGMGGGARGEVASKLAAQTVAEFISRCEWAQPEAALRDAFAAANDRVYAEGTGEGSASRSEMGTTLVAALVDDASGAAVIANVGDSRAYLVRASEIHQLTRDHSLIAERVAAGLLTEEEARTADERNIITRAIGIDPTVTTDVTSRGTVGDGDRLLLCTDGLHGLVRDEEILRLVATSPLHRSAGLLVDAANHEGGKDNITVLVGGLRGAKGRAPLVSPAAFAPAARAVRCPSQSSLLVAAAGGLFLLLLLAFGISRLLGSENPSLGGQAVGALVPANQPSMTHAAGFASPSSTSPAVSTPSREPGTVEPKETTTPPADSATAPTSTPRAIAPPSPSATPRGQATAAIQWEQPSATLISQDDDCTVGFKVNAHSNQAVYAYLRIDRTENESIRGDSVRVADGVDPVASTGAALEKLLEGPQMSPVIATITLVVSASPGGPPLINDGERIVGRADVSADGCSITTLLSASGDPQ